MRPVMAAALMLGLIDIGVAQAAPKPVVGEMAPDFELTLIDGSKVSLAELKGQVVLLNFWATWCVPCRKELPTLDSYYGLQKKHGLKMFAITTEGSVPIAQLKQLFAAMHIPSAKRIWAAMSIMASANSAWPAP